MTEKIPECFQKQAKSKCNIIKRRPKIQELQPIEYVDLIPPKEEKKSTDSEDETKKIQRISFL